MTPELWKTIRRWLDIVASILTVLTFVLTYWAVAVPFIPTILKYGWPIIAAYFAFRIFQFGRSLYERFTGLEMQVVEDRFNVNTRLEAQEKSQRDYYDEIVMSLRQEMQKRQDLEKILRLEIKEREKLEIKVVELKNELSALQKREPSPAELPASRLLGRGVLNQAG